MKKLLRKQWIKITAIVLFIVMSLGMLFTGLTTAVLASKDTFIDGGIHARRSVVSSSIFWNKMEMAYECYKAYAASTQGDSTNTEKHHAESTYYESFFSEEKSNFFFVVTDLQGNELFKSYFTDDYQYSEGATYKVLLTQQSENRVLSFETYQERWAYIQKCQGEYYNVDYTYWDEDTDGDGNYECVLNITLVSGDEETVNITGFVKTDLTAVDEFYNATFWLDRLIEGRNTLLVIFAAFFTITVILFVVILQSAGHRESVEEICDTWVEKIPFDIHMAICVGVFMGAIVAISDIIGNSIITLIAAVILADILLTALILSFTVRVKKGEWWRNTLIYKVLAAIVRLLKCLFRVIRYVVRSLPGVWKTFFVFIAVSVAEMAVLIVYHAFAEIVFFFWIFEKFIVGCLLVVVLMNMKKLKEGAEQIASGNLGYKLDYGYMFGDFKEHAEKLNSINKGMSVAVEEQLKSERLKTELITNVSHDIKTPLTSIVNYVDLLKKEGGGTEKAQEYIAVLDKHSSRLKKLTEDLLEAAKTSTGNVIVNMDQVNVGLLLQQAAGEYDSKFRENNLSIVMDLARELPNIQADGKLLWRVFDNLLSNACKYSLSGTRIYITAELRAQTVEISFKNVSAYPLNISSDELMERFVRGDSSRSTEGSGLGLSIARSLVELQSGTFDIFIDGDLFKVIIVFPINETSE